METTEPRFGEQVTITNPNYPDSTWTGKLISYRDHPCVTIEFEDGSRTCLPQAWMVRDE